MRRVHLALPSALPSVLLVLLAVMAPLGVAQEPSPGLRVERVRATIAPEVPIGDRIITIVRVDPARYRFRFVLAQRDGPRRPAPAWVRDLGLTGAINAGMFLPSGRPLGVVQEDGALVNDRRPRGYLAAIGFDPPGRPPAFGVGGPGCPLDLDGMRRAFGSVLQSNRVIVDCQGRARTDWRTARYSAALLGADRDGNAVFVHVRTPYRMQVLARMLAAPELGLRGLVYMEGGPEASLVVQAEGVQVSHMGSWEDGFWPNDDNHQFWDLPNVVAFEPRR